MNQTEIINKLEELKERKSALDTEIAVSKSKIHELCTTLGISPKRADADKALEEVTKDLAEITETIDRLVAEYKETEDAID